MIDLKYYFNPSFVGDRQEITNAKVIEQIQNKKLIQNEIVTVYDVVAINMEVTKLEKEEVTFTYIKADLAGNLIKEGNVA